MGTAEEFASKLAAESTGATVVLAIPVKAEHMQNDNFGVLPPWDSPATLSLCPVKKWEYFTTGYRTFSPFHFSFHSHKVHEVPTIPWTCRQGISECTDEPRAILVAQCVPVGILVPKIRRKGLVFLRLTGKGFRSFWRRLRSVWRKRAVILLMKPLSFRKSIPAMRERENGSGVPIQ